MAINAILSSAFSGLRAASVRTESAAGNIANLQTPDYQASTVANRTLVSGPSLTGGTAVDAQLFNRGGEPNLTREIVRLIEAEIAYKANAAVVRSGEEIARETLDVTA